MQKFHGTSIGTDESGRRQNLIACHTLVDISKTGVISLYRKEIPMFMDDAEQIVRDQRTWERSRNQQRNFETVTQIIGLRAQPINLEIPHKVKVDLAEHKFGTDFTGVQAVWSFTFTVEHTAVFDRDNTSLRALVLDMDNIPCIIKMTETVTIVSPVFRSQGTSSNIYFEKII